MAPSGRHPRQSSSSVYNMFDNKQVQQFKEAFSMIDQDGDGLITEKDLVEMLTSLGQNPTPSLLSSLLTFRGSETSSSSSLDPSSSRAGSGGINFTMFLTMMSEHLVELDPEQELIEAFECFDENDKGTIKCHELREWLSAVGDKMSEEEINRLLSPPFTDRNGTTFNYKDFVRTLRVHDPDEEEAANGK